jgi:hypothetical protein
MSEPMYNSCPECGHAPHGTAAGCPVAGCGCGISRWAPRTDKEKIRSVVEWERLWVTAYCRDVMAGYRPSTVRTYILPAEMWP